jgi:putative transposase
MFKRLKVQIYPTKKQEIILQNHFDGYRFAYNLCLDYKTKMWNWYKIPLSGNSIEKELLKLRHEAPFLKICKSECIRQASIEVDNTYQKFFKDGNYPKFKKKDYKQTFSYEQAIIIKNNKLQFLKSLYNFKTSDKYLEKLKNTKIKKCTFIKEKTGKYFATFLIEDKEVKILPKTNKLIGIDLGIKTFVTTSDGQEFENLKLLQKQKYKLLHLKRKFSKTQKGGKNREKLRIKIAKTHEKIINQRNHYYHQISNKLISDNQTIIIENLVVKNLVKNHKLAKSINDVSWSLFTNMLEYKSNWYGRELIKVSTFYPSSKLCSNCGNKKDTLLLSTRTYNCFNCGFTLNRDLNAAINIKKEGLRLFKLKNSGIKIPVVSMENTNCGFREVESNRLIIKN